MSSYLLLALSSVAGAGRIGRGDDGCARTRRDKARVLHLPAGGLHILSDHSGSVGAGWRLGVLHRECKGERFGPYSDCVLNAYRQGSPPALEYVRRSTAKTMSPTDPQLQADLIDALIEWRPSYVQPAMVDGVQHWEFRIFKTKFLAVAGGIGIRTPWTRRVRATRLFGDEIKEFESLLPLVIKTDFDDNGREVVTCHDRTCLQAALIRYAMAGERVIQQYVSGPTLAYDGTALDGQILGGFARARTIGAPEVAGMVAKLAAHLRYTGYFNLDWVVDSTSGLPYLIDPNMRGSPAMSHDGTVLGMGDNLLVRLRQVVSGELPLSHFSASWKIPLEHSIVETTFHHNPKAPSDLMYCSSVHTTFPRAGGVRLGSPRLDGAATKEIKRLQPGLSIQLMCGRRNASRNWRKFAHCVERRKAGGKQAPVPYDDGYWDRVGLTLCRDMRK
ncbi:hypothetical protein T492DRAFT_840324 [Pavlovales sp. CCMP2436]|nr:hypothetical protein T492DRAFT_840324 [Pavlovales sp. CCMP2436]